MVKKLAKKVKNTKQWPIVTSSNIRRRHISSILYHKHFSYPIMKICLGKYVKTAPVT